MATEDNREKIVDMALQLFSTRGPKSVTMDDIAQALHISKRTLYETFANKEELLVSCLTHIRDLTDEMHRQTHSRAGEPLLVAMYMLRTNALFIQRYRRIIEETERYYPAVHDRFFRVHSSHMRETLVKGMEYARQRGFLRKDADTDVAIDFFLTVIRYRRLSDMHDVEKYTKKINELCFTYLRGMLNTDTLLRYDSSEGLFEQVLAETHPEFHPTDNNNNQIK